MKLFEINKIPRKVGDAEIIICNEEFPRRKDCKIYLPEKREMDFFWLQGGQQFLCHYYEKLNNIGTDRESVENPICYFGGMDESLFLVRLNSDFFRVLCRGGEKAFFDTLKPDGVKTIELATRTSAKRQGDIFAVELPFTLKQLKIAEKLGGRGLPVPSLKDGKFNIFNTRHIMEAGLSSENPYSRVVVLDGLLKAPDHKNLELPGLYFVEQSQGLYAPKEAD